ncbi:MAG: PcfB family protein [Solobacterium sp.]|jgi:hypothetical protein|nr:PcfB family protein [Solobacterium sp.]
MNPGGDTADQMAKMTLEGIEVAAKISGSAAKSLAAMLYAMLNDKKKVKGKTRLDALLRSGKELKVFALRHDDLKVFCEEAKRYGVLYSVLKEKNNTDGICDIMVRAEDAAKISRIVDKFELATIDTKAIRESIMSQKENPLKDVKPMTPEEHDKLIESLMDEANPTRVRTEKSDRRSGRSSKSTKTNNAQGRTSVRKTLAEIRKETSTKPQVKKPPVRKKQKGRSRS